MDIVSPRALRIEHEELHQRVAAIARLPGAVGEAAREVSKLLLPHVQKEEAVAFPPLALLPQIAEGQLRPEMESMLPLTERLRRELPHLKAEHHMVIAALDVLINEATEAGASDPVRFAEELNHHMRLEEEIYYPAAILVGELIRRGG